MQGIKFEPNGLAHVVDMDIPTPGKGQVVLKVTSTGVCGSDLSALRGTHLFRKPPLISGHEAGGIVDALGEGVEGFEVGDRVVVDPQKPCGDCELCNSGSYHLCPKKLMLGVAEWDGSFAHYVEVPAYTLIPAPDEIKDEYLALAEPIAVAAHAVRQAPSVDGKTALVLGGGTIGGLITRVLADQGATVTVSEPREFLAETLTKLGASTVVVPEDLDETLFDLVFIVAGVPALVETAMTRSKPGAAIIQVAVFGNEVPLHVGKLQVGEKSIRGSAMYQKDDYVTALDLLARYPEIPELVVSKIVGIEEGAEIITEMAKSGPGDILKLVIVP